MFIIFWKLLDNLLEKIGMRFIWSWFPNKLSMLRLLVCHPTGALLGIYDQMFVIFWNLLDNLIEKVRYAIHLVMISEETEHA